MLEEEALNMGLYRPITDWYDSFAWLPVETVDRGWKWLVPVKKRRMKYGSLADYKTQYVSINAFKEEGE